MLERGFVANDWAGEPQKEFNAMAATVQKHLTGRMFSAEVLARVKTLAANAK